MFPLRRTLKSDEDVWKGPVVKALSNRIEYKHERWELKLAFLGFHMPHVVFWKGFDKNEFSSSYMHVCTECSESFFFLFLLLHIIKQNISKY